MRLITSTLKKIFLLFFITSFLVACNKKVEPIYSPQFSAEPLVKIEKEYIFAVHPLHNPQRLFKVFNPLMIYLSNNIDNASFKLKASRNYAAFDERLLKKEFDFALPNPFQTINAIDNGYNAFAKMGDDESFRGIIIVRKDSEIKKPVDLIGKAVSYPAPTALAATMMPQYYLQQHGVNVLEDLDNRYVGSQDSSIMNVIVGNTVAASTWPLAYKAFLKERPELEQEIKVIWQTDFLINNGLVAKKEVPNKIVEQVAYLLINLHKTQQGRDILEGITLSKFEKANNKTFDVVRRFLKDFVEKVRPI